MKIVRHQDSKSQTQDCFLKTQVQMTWLKTQRRSFFADWFIENEDWVKLIFLFTNEWFCFGKTNIKSLMEKLREVSFSPTSVPASSTTEVFGNEDRPNHFPVNSNAFQSLTENAKQLYLSLSLEEKSRVIPCGTEIHWNSLESTEFQWIPVPSRERTTDLLEFGSGGKV